MQQKEVLMIGLDNCLFDEEYKKEKQNGNEQAVIRANQKLFEELLNHIKQKGFKKVVLNVFSNRQSGLVDEYNMKLQKTESFFAAMQKIREYFQEKLKDNHIICEWDNYLLTHLFHDVEPKEGEKFLPEKEEISKLPVDTSRFINLYLYVQRMASQQKESNFEYYIVGAFSDKLKDIQAFLRTQSSYVPEGGTICFYTYQDKDLVFLEKIEGIGNKDETYKETIEKICTQSGVLNSDEKPGKKSQQSFNSLELLKKYPALEDFTQTFQPKGQKRKLGDSPDLLLPAPKAPKLEPQLEPPIQENVSSSLKVDSFAH